MITTIETLFPLWQQNKGNRKLIGIDWGEKHIGIAVSDKSGIIASPLCTVVFRANKKVQKHMARPHMPGGSINADRNLKNNTRLFGEKGCNHLGNGQSATEAMKGVIIRKSPEQLLQETVRDVTDIIKREVPLAVSVGIPINMNGSHGFQSQKVVRFAEVLAENVPPDMPIIFTDERLSSAAVEKTMISADITRAKRARLIDKTSAAYVLQQVVDMLNQCSAPGAPN
ncbi:MAG: Holliday junction resolvase RuvX [Holosporales bacterium]|jgi:putative Holliday junction resolvase|nr:Holliday junction resolvase RuvX [Holosporales bacterium]